MYRNSVLHYFHTLDIELSYVTHTPWATQMIELFYVAYTSCPNLKESACIALTSLH